jgi:hypothetical protein
MPDTVVRHRPFWSVFILGTEKWLGVMSSSGLHLCDLNFHGRFRFKVGNPKKCRYCFTYAKFDNNISGGKSNKYEWEKVAKQDRWCVYKSEKETQKATIPNRRGLYLRNNSLLCLYALISSIVLLIALGMVFGIFAYFSSSSASNDDFFSQAIIIIGIFAMLLLGNFAFFLSMTSANNRILEEPGDATSPEKAYRQFISYKTFELWLEKLLIKDGEIFKKFHPLWLISPRSFEKWLSRMEKQGYNVYKVHKSGLLYYFIKSAPRKIKYCVVSSEGGNISQCIENGWQVVYSTAGRFKRLGNIAVISKAFEEKPPIPFKSEKDYISNAARIMSRFVLIYFIILIVLIAVFFTLVYIDAANALIWAAGVVVFIITLLIARMLLYFANTVLITRRAQFKQNSPQ